MHFSPTMQSTRRWGELCTCLPRDGMKSLQLEFELKLGNFGSLTLWPCQITLSILLMNCKLSLVWWFPNSKWAHCFLPVWTPYSIPRSLLSEYNPPVCPQSLKEVSRLPSSSCITSLLTSDTCDTAEAFKSKPKMHLVVYSLNTPGLELQYYHYPSGRSVSVNVTVLFTVIVILNDSVEPTHIVHVCLYMRLL